jgi:hypothetical protein
MKRRPSRKKRKQKNMMQSNFVVSLADMRYVEIHCPICKTKVTLDMQEPPEYGKKYGFFTPKICPGCQKDYDTAIRPAVDAFQRAYESLLSIPETVTFRGVSSHEVDDRV